MKSLPAQHGWVVAAAAEAPVLTRFGGSAPRWCLTLALTGTALAARSREDKRLNGDVSSKVHLQGRVRGRMPRLGKYGHDLFAGTRGAIETGAI
jgi:hypothetical protein